MRISRVSKDLEKAGVIAIGEPDSVPAGKYAVQTLTSLNLLDRLQQQDGLRQGMYARYWPTWKAGTPIPVWYIQTDAGISEQVKVVDVSRRESSFPPALSGSSN